MVQRAAWQSDKGPLDTVELGSSRRWWMVSLGTVLGLASLVGGYFYARPFEATAPPARVAGPEPPPMPLPPSIPQKKWTVMMYCGNDNNLHDCIVQNLKDLEKLGTNGDLNLVAQISYGEAGVRRVVITPDGQQELNFPASTRSWFGLPRWKNARLDVRPDSPVVDRLNSTNTADGEALSAFVQWAHEKFPAENTVLIVNTHGGGWRGAISDDTHGGWMDLPTLHNALKTVREATGRKVNVLAFDACLMSSAEVAYELRQEIDFLVASQEVVGGAGWPYPQMIGSGTFTSATPRQWAVRAVEDARRNPHAVRTLAALDMAGAADMAKAVDRFAEAIKSTKTPDHVLRHLASSTQRFHSYHDLYDFAHRVSKNVEDEALKEAALAVTDSVRGMVVAETHTADHPHAHGVSIQLFGDGDVVAKDSPYRNTALGRDTEWADATSRLGPTPPPPRDTTQDVLVALGVLLGLYVSLALRERLRRKSGG